MAIARVSGGTVESWQEVDVGWGMLHDAGPEGQHHARVARFLQEHGVQAVVAEHMGDGMKHMLARLGVAVHVGAAGSAREAVATA